MKNKIYFIIILFVSIIIVSIFALKLTTKNTADNDVLKGEKTISPTNFYKRAEKEGISYREAAIKDFYDFPESFQKKASFEARSLKLVGYAGGDM